MFRLKPWLWVATALAALLVAAAAIVQLVGASSSGDSTCGPNCDPHGYAVIFSAFPALVVVLLALSAAGSLVARRRVGLWLALVAAIGCSGELFLLWSLMAIWLAALIGLVIAATVALVILGLRNAPVRAAYPAA
ncbi:hypothetical protein ACI2LF_03675 [Kribbella sp. NPDC020789]